MSFNFFGVGSGLVKGLQYDVQFQREVVWAIRNGNAEALTALAHIAETNVKEIVGTAKEVTQSHAIALLFDNDPFQGSRQLMHDYQDKFGKH